MMARCRYRLLDGLSERTTKQNAYITPGFLIIQTV
jgi:hypothetical protein